MPTFTYGSAPSTDGEVDYMGLHNTALTLQYVNFRTDNGSLWQERGLDDGYKFQEQDGQVLRVRDDKGKLLAASVVISPEYVDRLYVDYIEMKLKVIKPVTHFGTPMTLALKVKGLHVTSDTGFDFTQHKTGLMRTVIELGFNWRLADPTGQYHDPTYVLDRMVKNCTTPLSVAQIILGVFDPILHEASEAGLLVEAHTKPTNAWIKWDPTDGYVQAITDRDILDQIWAEVEGLDEQQVESQDSGIIVQDTGRTLAYLNMTQDEVKALIIQAKDGLVACTLTGDPVLEPNPRTDEIYQLILESEPGFKKGPEMLNRIKESTLVAIHAAIFAKEEEEAAL